MIGLFFMDVVQLRFTLCLAFVLWSLYFLARNNNIRDVVLCALFLFLAMLVHFSALLFGIFILARYLSTKKNIMIVVIGGISLYTIYNIFIGYFGEFWNMSSKVELIGETDFKSKHSLLTTTISALLILCMTIFAKYNLRRDYRTVSDIMKFALNISILTLICIPLINYSQDIRRHIYIFYFVCAALIYSMLPKFKNKNIVAAFPIFIAVIYFIVTVFTGNRDSVFFPIFTNNLLIDLFSII